MTRNTRSIKRFDVFLVALDPTVGTEIQKTRPCVIISPDELTAHLNNVVVVPMTTQGHTYPWRPECNFKGKRGLIVIDQMRTIDKSRLVKKMGKIDNSTAESLIKQLQEFFAP